MTLIELDDKYKFENAVKLLMLREQCLKINVSKSSNVNAVQNMKKRGNTHLVTSVESLVIPPRGVTKGTTDGAEEEVDDEEEVADDKTTVDRCPEWRKYPSYICQRKKMSPAMKLKKK